MSSYKVHGKYAEDVSSCLTVVSLMSLYAHVWLTVLDVKYKNLLKLHWNNYWFTGSYKQKVTESPTCVSNSFSELYIL